MDYFIIDKILILLATHWVSDFLLQSREVAEKKSSSLKVLFTHVSIYTAGIFFIYGYYALSMGDMNLIRIMPLLAGITFISHFITDYFTSKWTSKLYQKGDVKGFFSVIGFDQFLHQAQLILTLTFLL